MTFKSLFNDNKLLFQEMEDASYEMLRLHPIIDEARLHELYEQKKILKRKIEVNLNNIEYLWSKEKVVHNRATKRINTKPDVILSFYKEHRSMPLTIMADKLKMKHEDVSRVVTEYLVKKWC